MPHPHGGIDQHVHKSGASSRWRGASSMSEACPPKTFIQLGFLDGRVGQRHGLGKKRGINREGDSHGLHL